MKLKKDNERKKEIIRKVEENPSDKNLIKDNIYLYPEILEYIDEKLFKDKEFCKELLYINGMALKYIPKEMKEDKEVVIIALKSSAGFALRYADEKLKADIEIVKQAILKYKKPLKYASEDLQIYFKSRWEKYYKNHPYEKWSGYYIAYNGIKTSKEDMDRIYEEENKKKKKDKNIESQNSFEEIKDFLEENQIKFNEYNFEEKDD